jgi:hypothetical protein
VKIKVILLALGVLAIAGCVDQGGTRSVVQTGPITLSAVQATILTPRCATSGCHSQGGIFGLDLSSGLTYGATVGVSAFEMPGLQRVTPFDATNSYLYMKVAGDPRIQGDVMPLSGPPLTTEQLRVIEDWINEGALP